MAEEQAAGLTQIPFNRPLLLGPEILFAQEAVASGQISGDGAFTYKASRLLEEILPAPKVLLTTSCTHALEMTALLLNLKEGDEVIVPSFTFVSTVNAFVLRGAKPVFGDIRPDTLNLDETRLEALITARTRAIYVVHYAGVACEMNAIQSIARRLGIPIIEDNAHGLLGSYAGKGLGTFAGLATLSFHETKNFTCGEGGALVINDPAYIERAEILREKGTDRSRFFRGQVDKYSWVDVGSSYLPSDILAAYLYAQLSAREQIQARRRTVWEAYREGLAAWAADHEVRLPVVPEGCQQAYHMFYLLLPSLEDRQRLIAHLRSQGITAVFHYLPLHLSTMGRRFGGRPGDCPVTEDVSARLVRLPFFYDLAEADQQTVIRELLAFDSWSRPTTREQFA
jgi:dTDP-4-amino-4,6-dideoxygalactose transaminase